MSERKLCYGCMDHVVFQNGICPHCGYYEDATANASFLQPGAELHDRYVVGAAISLNGEGVTYIAYDRSVGCKVLLREYMPMNLCMRVEGTSLIRVSPKKLPQYKVLMEDFTDLNKSLAHLREQGQIHTVTDLFAENNTTYVVFEYIDGMRFVDFLKENAGELSWAQLSGMLPSLLNALNLLHGSGIIHRAISPETIYVTSKYELLLTDFSVAAARTADTELECEIYSGYAAPEQYSAINRQGTWTDVYAVCAVIYRVLTGSMPTSAISRMENDNLIAPCLLNPNISHYISDVIMQGLNLVSTDRIQNVTELVTKLFNEPPSYRPHVGAAAAGNHVVNGGDAANTQGYAYYPENNPPEYIDNGQQEYTDDYSYDGYGNESYQKHEHYKQEAPSAIDKVKVPLIIGMLLLVILMVVIYFMLSGDEESGNTDPVTTSVTVVTAEEQTEAKETGTEPQGDSIMPRLIGKNYEAQVERYSGWIQMEAEEVFDEDYPAGVIIWQSVEEGAYFDKEKPVSVRVSKGSSKINLPKYSGKTLYEYIQELDELGVKYHTEYETSASHLEGTVIRLSIDLSEKYDLEKQEEIVVYYAIAPVTEPPTEPPTEAPPEEITTEAPPVVTDPPATEPVVTEPPVVTDVVDPAFQAGGMIY